MNLTKAGAKIFVSRLLSALITFGAIVLFTRSLTQEKMGVYFLFEAVLGVLMIPADFGIRGAVEKRLSEGRMRSEIVSTSIVLKGALFVFIAVVVLASTPIINEYLGDDLAHLLIISIFFREFGQLSRSVLQGELRVGETAILNLSKKVIWGVLGGYLVLNGHGPKGIVYALIIGEAALLIWGWYKSSVPVGKPSKQAAYSLIDFSRYHFISDLGRYVYGWVDILVIGLILSQSSVASYEVSWRVLTLVLLSSRTVAVTIFPKLSQLNASDEKELLESLVSKSIFPTLFLTVPAFFGSVGLSTDILVHVFGPGYGEASVVLVILLFGGIIEGVKIVIEQALQALDRPDLSARATLIGGMLNVTFNVVLIWVFGLVGAAIATTVATLVGGLGLRIYYLKGLIEIEVDWKETSWILVSSIVMAIAVVALNSNLETTSVLELTLMVLVGVLLYLGLVLSNSGIRGKVRETTRQIS